MKQIIPSSALIILLLLSSCSTETTCKNLTKATVIQGIDGCGLLLKLENNNILNPTNLNEMGVTLKVDQKVEITFHEVEMMNICMMGKTVELDCIEIFE